MNANVSPPPPVLAGCATLFQSIPVPWFDDTSTPNVRVPLGFTTLARNHIDTELPDVKSIVGFGCTFTGDPLFDVLNRSLLSDFLPVQGARGFGLYLLDRIAPLRRAVMREGVEPAAQPRLMRGEAL